MRLRHPIAALVGVLLVAAPRATAGEDRGCLIPQVRTKEGRPDPRATIPLLHRVLGAIGTATSVPDLERIAREDSQPLGLVAQQALRGTSPRAPDGE
jgi:hypothetical protein